MPDLRILLTERPDLVLTIDDDFIGSAYSPQVEVEAIEGGHSVTITHKGPEGIESDTFDVMDGATGPQGPDGYSPTVAISSTANEHTVTITDRQGPHSYSVPTYASEEAARDAAERAREQAETVREAAWATLSEQATTATQAANNAAQAASQAASDATDAAQAASQTAISVASAEQGRVQAEQARVTAEQGRATAEQGRVSAETARATEWAEIESDAQSAINAAQDAADDATAAAAEARAASAATWLSGNVLFGELAESAVLTADDVYTAPPKGVEVFGVSTQDGTPTPDAPVEIKSVDDLTLVITGKNLFDYPTEPFTNTTASVYNGYYFSGGFRSIPNGVDTITASMYIDNSAATDASSLTVWAHNSNGAVVAIGGALIGAGNTGRVSKTYDVSNYNDFALGGLIRPNASVSQLMAELGTTATAYEPYVGQSVQVPLSDHYARSLPDGTRDTLTLSYIGPSTREGWGVFSKTLVQHVGHFTATNSLGWNKSSSATNGYYSLVSYVTDGLGKALVGKCIQSPMFKAANSVSDYFTTTNSCWVDNSLNFNIDPNVFSGTAAEFGQWVAQNGIEFDLPLATPITHDLGTVELPILPNPLTAWADGGSAQPTMQIEYERSLSIVIPRIEAAISDLATS